MKKKTVVAFTALVMSSALLAAEVSRIPESVEYKANSKNDDTTPRNHLEDIDKVSSENNQSPPRDPLEDLGNEESVSSEEAYDPFEPLNRCLFVLNQMIDGLILRPVSVVYDAVLPEVVRDSVSNVLSNLWEPVSFVNYVLQGSPNEAGVAITRFAINSTLGLAGVMDIAHKMDVPGENTGFADTLSVWGVGTGPYIMIPLLGPSTFRGAAGLTADYFADPINYYLIHKAHKKWLVYTRTGVEIIDNRYRLLDTLDELEANSVDFYAAIRSIHFQRLAYKDQQRHKNNND